MEMLYLPDHFLAIDSSGSITSDEQLFRKVWDSFHVRLYLSGVVIHCLIASLQKRVYFQLDELKQASDSPSKHLPAFAEVASTAIDNAGKESFDIG